MFSKFMTDFNADEFLDTVLEALPHPFYLIDVADYRVVAVNAAAREAGILVSTPCYVQTHGQSVPCKATQHPCPMRRVLETQQPVVVEHMHSDKHGVFRYVEVHAHPIMNQHGEVVQVIEYTLDVTEKQRVSGALQASEARFRRLIEESGDGMVIVDEHGILRFLNPAAERLLGQSAEQIVGEIFGFPTVAGETTRLNIVVPRTAAEDPGQPRVTEMRVVETLWESAPAYLATLRDITARVQAEEALEHQAQELARSNEALERFAYVASHHLQEPLRTITNYVQLLARRYKHRLDSDADTFLEYIVEGVTYMSELLRDLLLYSRMDKEHLTSQPVAIEIVLQRVLWNLRDFIEDTGALVTYDEVFPVVLANAMQLEWVFENLLVNALKFRAEAAPHIHISARAETDEDGVSSEDEASYWVISVRDNGIGIEPEYTERIFAVFERLHPRNEYPGTGVGLALCRKIVEKHGGRIWVESQAGVGSTFHFMLPAA